jgi:hypothetical protein
MYMYTSECVLFIYMYSVQIFGYDSLWYNCSIVIIFYFPWISLFYSFVCSSHLCILSYIHVPYGAFFINKEFEFEFVIMANHMISLITSSTTTLPVYLLWINQ